MQKKIHINLVVKGFQDILYLKIIFRKIIDLGLIVIIIPLKTKNSHNNLINTYYLIIINSQ